ncbi:DUF1796 family putative cysteine peptidase [Campylobacter sp. LR264d]|uniref:DUF1796 family putative cysteine peptidase n=2 Tax=Campylobacter TaxID=194 RepID=UPI0016804691|nr:DUF1796 family putative cysteine peptidase [Campylobacter sp. LR264d]
MMILQENASIDLKNVDLVLSLGNSCRSVHHIKEHNLRLFATPLDWVGNYDLKTAFYCFETNFKNFFIECEKIGEDEEKQLISVRDKNTNMTSRHHFLLNKPLELQIPEFNQKMQKRYKRMQEYILKAKKIVLVNMGKDSLEEVENFLRKIHNFWQNDKELYFIKIIHNEKMPRDSILTKQYLIDKNLHLLTYEGNDTSLDESSKYAWRGNEIIWKQALKNIQLKKQFSLKYLCQKGLYTTLMLINLVRKKTY